MRQNHCQDGDTVALGARIVARAGHHAGPEHAGGLVSIMQQNQNSLGTRRRVPASGNTAHNQPFCNTRRAHQRSSKARALTSGWWARSCRPVQRARRQQAGCCQFWVGLRHRQVTNTLQEIKQTTRDMPSCNWHKVASNYGCAIDAAPGPLAMQGKLVQPEPRTRLRRSLTLDSSESTCGRQHRSIGCV